MGEAKECEFIWWYRNRPWRVQWWLVPGPWWRWPWRRQCKDCAATTSCLTSPACLQYWAQHRLCRLVSAASSSRSLTSLVSALLWLLLTSPLLTKQLPSCYPSTVVLFLLTLTLAEVSHDITKMGALFIYRLLFSHVD